MVFVLAFKFFSQMRCFTCDSYNVIVINTFPNGTNNKCHALFLKLGKTVIENSGKAKSVRRWICITKNSGSYVIVMVNKNFRDQHRCYLPFVIKVSTDIERVRHL